MTKIQKLALLAAITGILESEHRLESGNVLVDANTFAWDLVNQEEGTPEEFYAQIKSYEEKIKHEWK